MTFPFSRLASRPAWLACCLLFPGFLLAGPGPRQRPTPEPLHLQVRRIAPGVFVHTSFHRLPGQSTPVSANGLIVSTKKGAVLVDAAWEPEQTLELLRWVADSLHQRVRLAVVSHAHADRLGGLAVLRANHINVYSTPQTARLAARLPYGTPTPALKPYTLIRAGRTRLELYFPGPGHSSDNLVAWLPRERVLFGGCLVKDADATTLGNLADANLAQWPSTIGKVAARYPKAELVVPGHGPWGGPALLRHTLRLVEAAKKAKPQTALNSRP